MKTLFILFSIIFGSQAFASGSYGCDVNDSVMEFTLSGGLSHGLPGKPFNENGSMVIKAEGYQKTFDLPAITESTQFWMMDGEMNILVYNEPNTQKFMTSTLVIKTKLNEEDATYSGTYSLRIEDGETNPAFEGPITCTTE